MMYSQTVTMGNAAYIRKHTTQEIGYNVEFTFNYESDEVTATFTCSDDFTNLNLCHNREDLEEYIIRRYGAFLIKDNISTPKNFNMSMKKIGQVLSHPAYRNRDDYQAEYSQALTREEWLRLKLDIPELRPEGRMFNSAYTPEKYLIRLGLWQGHG